MLGILGGLLTNKWFIYIIGALAGLLMTGGLYMNWKNKIEANAKLEFNNEQLQQVIKEQERFLEQNRQLTEEQNKLIEDAAKEREALNNKLEELKTYIDSPEAAKSDRESSEIVKETIRRLQELKDEQDKKAKND